MKWVIVAVVLAWLYLALAVLVAQIIHRPEQEGGR